MGSTFDFGTGTELEAKHEPVERWNNHRSTEFAKALVAPHKLLYLSRSGSHLHGTDTETSDADFKGIFLPHEEFCLLDQQPRRFTYSSGNDDTRNTSDDVDFELWSVHEWLDLMAKGDSNALSVLFSAFVPNMSMYCDRDMAELLTNSQYLFNPNNVDGFTGFAKGQATKYGLKGSRLKVVQRVMEWLQMAEDNGVRFENVRLGDFDLDELVEFCQTEENKDKDYISVFERDGQMYLKLLTKEHQFTTRMPEFRERVQREHDKYGHRARTSASLDGKEWKSLSHSLRSLYEAEEMLINGYVAYPLSSRDELLMVKKGEVSLEQFTQLYNEMERRVQTLSLSPTRLSYLNVVKRNKMVLNLYRKDKEE